MEALSASFPNFEPQWITAREAGELVGFMPLVSIAKGPFRSILALPFGTYGDPVAGDIGVSKMLVREFFDRSKEPGCLEAEANLFFAGSGERLPTFDTGGADYLSRSVRVRIAESRIINIEGGFEEYWRKGLTKKRRQTYKRGGRAGVVIRPLEREEEVAAFYENYKTESASWGGVHPYPRAFFFELFRKSGEGVVIWGGFVAGELLGGHINFYFGDMAQAWQAGMSERSREYGIDIMLVVEAVAEACRREMKIYNLGSSSGHEGIILFKKLLGGREYRYPVVTARKRWWGWLKQG